MDQKEKDEEEYLDLSKEEIYFEHRSKTVDDDEFDQIVSCLEEILFDDTFMREQSDFFEQHCDIFEDNEENKIEYTLRIPFPSEHYAESAMRALGVDAPF